MNEATKRCNDCGEDKPTSDFSKAPTNARRSRFRLLGRCKPCEAMHWRLRIYDLTREQYEDLRQRQGGLCAICRSNDATQIDHCHETGRVRGLLCGHCNRLLGNAKDNVVTPQAATVYVTAVA